MWISYSLLQINLMLEARITISLLCGKGLLLEISPLIGTTCAATARG